MHRVFRRRGHHLDRNSNVNDLFNYKPRKAFGGKTYEPKRDYVRLRGQLLKVFDTMKDGQWRTLRGIRMEIGPASEASISARLRDLRKKSYGAHTVERVNIDGGLFKYRLIVNETGRG